MLFHDPGGSACYIFGVLHLLAFCIAQGKIYALLHCNLGVLLLHLGCSDFVRMFDYCVMVISLSMYVMAVCTFHPPGHFVFKDAQGHSGRPPFAALSCALLYRSSTLRCWMCCITPKVQDTQLSARQLRAGHECLCAYTSCLCLSVCLGNLLLYAVTRKTASACFFQVYQNKMLFACQCQRLLLSLLDRQRWSGFQQLQQQLGTVGAAIIPSAQLPLCCASADL